MVVYATGSVVGNGLAPSPMLATLPISVFVVGMAACILPLDAMAQRRGRRMAFMAGAGAGVLVGLLALAAVVGNGEMVAEYHTYYGSAALILVNDTHRKLAKRQP